MCWLWVPASVSTFNKVGRSAVSGYKLRDVSASRRQHHLCWCRTSPLTRSLVPAKLHRYSTPFQSIMKSVVGICKAVYACVVLSGRTMGSASACEKVDLVGTIVDVNHVCNSTSAKVRGVQGACCSVELQGMEVEAVNPLIRSRSSHQIESHGQFRFRGPQDVSEVSGSPLCVLGLRIVVLAVTSAQAP